MTWKGPLYRITDYKWKVPQDYKSCMRTDATIFTDNEMIPQLRNDDAAEQVVNVACLPGIVGNSLAMPDIHWGYGFPIGGVAALDAEEGVISPGGIGFDINCGVRLIRTDLREEDVVPKIKDLMGTLYNNVPAGVGSKGVTDVAASQIDDILDYGSKWAVESGYGWDRDLEVTEENGYMDVADSSKVSDKAKKRGVPQVGSLGSGNHFLEVDRVEKIIDQEKAEAFGITEEGQVTVTIHCGSRGCGHQIATDYLKEMERSVKKRGIDLPDKQLACAPVTSDDGQDYYKAMACGANYAWANRQMILHWVRQSFEEVMNAGAEDMGMDMVYDVAHNIAKLEEHEVEGKRREVYVHRKGATRAFPAGHPEVPQQYSSVGQPVLIPGNMGAGSYVLVGTDEAMKQSFGSTCHGAGRTMSRRQATRVHDLTSVKSDLNAKGIYLRSTTKDGVLEEAPGAYKDVDHVVSIVENAGLSVPVARLKPLGVMKG